MENFSFKKSLLKRIKSSNLNSQSNLTSDNNSVKFVKPRETNFTILKKTKSIAFDNISHEDLPIKYINTMNYETYESNPNNVINKEIESSYLDRDYVIAHRNTSKPNTEIFYPPGNLIL